MMSRRVKQARLRKRVRTRRGESDIREIGKKGGGVEARGPSGGGCVSERPRWQGGRVFRAGPRRMHLRAALRNERLCKVRRCQRASSAAARAAAAGRKSGTRRSGAAARAAAARSARSVKCSVSCQCRF